MTTTGLSFPARRLVINNYNLLIIIIFSTLSCSSVKSQQKNDIVQYDSLTKTYVYKFVEQMPNYKGGNSAFLKDFGTYFQYHPQPNEVIQTKLRFQFVIDTKGHLVGARIYDKKPETLTNFEKAGLKALVLLQSWEAGKHNGKNVNVIIEMIIHINHNNG